MCDQDACGLAEKPTYAPAHADCRCFISSIYSYTKTQAASTWLQRGTKRTKQDGAMDADCETHNQTAAGTHWSMIWRPVCASKADRGSSSSTTSAAAKHARASATRCC